MNAEISISKYIYQALFFLFLSSSITVFSQGVSVNSTGNSAHSSAMLDVSSTTQGILVPRMTELQKTAIAAPATALMIYQTDGASPGFWHYDGNAWVQSIGIPGPAGTNGAPGATGSAGATGPAGPAAGSNPITHVSAVSGTSLTWLNCYNNCFNMSAVPASPTDGITYTDWRMPNAAEAVYYRSTFTPPGAGWLNSSYPNYIWTTDMHQSNENSWVTISESGSWNGNSTNTSMYCRCVR